MKLYAQLLPLLVLIGCSSPHKAKEVDSRVEIPAIVTSDAVIGIKDGDMIYQRKVLMSEELRNIQSESYRLEAYVYGGPRYLDNRGLYGLLKDCHMELGDSANRGDGKLRWLESRTYVIPEDELTVMGIENKTQIVGVSEELLQDRLARYRIYKKVLTGRQDEFETKVKACELELKAQRQATSDSILQ
ncbi:hypothetical protein D3C87_301060 [compost metagenome]